MGLLAFFTLLLLSDYVVGDMYLHNPRGSNNRLDEATRERRNANRYDGVGTQNELLCAV